MPLVDRIAAWQPAAGVSGLSPRLVRAFALLALCLVASLVVQIVFGFTGPARGLRAGAGSILGFGLIFGATAVAVYGLVLALLATPMFHWLRCAREPDPVLLRAVRVILGILAVVGVVLVTLGSFGLLLNLFAAADASCGDRRVGHGVVFDRGAGDGAGCRRHRPDGRHVTEFILSREIVPRLRLTRGRRLCAGHPHALGHRPGRRVPDLRLRWTWT